MPLYRIFAVYSLITFTAVRPDGRAYGAETD
jgi:hypothetical protein